jgi:ribosome maturation protein Sdo1
MEEPQQAIEAALTPVREPFHALDGDLTLDEVRVAISRLHTATEQADDDLREIKFVDLLRFSQPE